jgi:hypothetical protein
VSFLVDDLVFEHPGIYRVFVRAYHAKPADYFTNGRNTTGSSGHRGWICFQRLEGEIQVLDRGAESLEQSKCLSAFSSTTRR